MLISEPLPALQGGEEEGGKLFVGQEENRGRRLFLAEVGGKGRRREIIFLLLVCRVEKEATYLFGGSRLRWDESLEIS